MKKQTVITLHSDTKITMNHNGSNNIDIETGLPSYDGQYGSPPSYVGILLEDSKASTTIYLHVHDDPRPLIALRDKLIKIVDDYSIGLMQYKDAAMFKNTEGK